MEPFKIMEQQDLLQDLEQEIYLESASQGARFADFLIDGIAIRALIYIGGAMIAFLATPDVVSSDESLSISRVFYQSPYGLFLTGYLIAVLVNISYYTILEGSSNGRTLGKLVTGSKAIRQDGGPITWKDAFVRSLCRVVPFEVFSGFGTPWHDRWSNTQVVKVRR